MSTVFRRLSAAILSLSACFLLVGETDARAQAKVWAILVGDLVAEDIKGDMDHNIFNISNMLIGSIPTENLYVKIISKYEFNRNSIFREINNINPGHDDLVFFFYCGHGFYEPGRGTFVAPPADGGVRLYLSTIDQLVRAKNPRLSVVVFDCCSLRPEGNLLAPAPQRARPPTQVSPLFDQLFFRSKGTVVVVSSSPGQYALSQTPHRNPIDGNISIMPGSLFTNEFYNYMFISTNYNKNFTWLNACKSIRSQVSLKFRSFAPQGAIRLGNGIVHQQSDQTVVVRLDGQPF